MGKLHSCPRPQREVVSRVVQVEPEFKPRHHLGLSHASSLASHQPCKTSALPGNYLAGESLHPQLHRSGCPAHWPRSGTAGLRPLDACSLHGTALPSCFIQKEPDCSHPAPGTIAYHNRFPELNASSLERSSDTFH